MPDANSTARAPFDHLDEIVQAVGDKIDVIIDDGIQRGSQVLKALSLGAKAVGAGRFYLYPLAAAGQPGVERALGLMRAARARRSTRFSPELARRPQSSATPC